jgi:hypothetical protein
MPKINTAPFTQSHRIALTSLTSSDGNVAANPGITPTGTKLLVQAGLEGSIVKGINICSNDATKNLCFFLSKDSGATKYLISTVPAATNIGSISSLLPFTPLGLSSISGIQGMPSDQTGSQVMYLEAGDSLYVGLLSSSVTSGRNIYIVTIIEDF